MDFSKLKLGTFLKNIFKSVDLKMGNKNRGKIG